MKETQKINTLNRRVQAVYRKVSQSEDGWQEEWVDGPFIWAGITPIPHTSANAYEQEDLLHGKASHTLYRLLMRRAYDCELPQSSIRRLCWDQNVVEVVYPWQEQVNSPWLESIGKITDKRIN